MKDKYTLRYSGRETDDGQMGYYDAASVILAFGDFVGIVSRASFGKDCKLKTSVATPKEGSLSFNFLLASGSIVTTLMGVMSPNDLWNLMRDCVEAWKFLRGKPPQEIVNEKERVKIINYYGDFNTFNRDVILVIKDPSAGKAVERVFNKTLNGAASKVDITSAQVSGEKIEVSADDAEYFVDLSERKIQTDQVIGMTFHLISPVFVNGNKWKFNDGEQNFSAAIEDEEFLRKVGAGESFANGDFLIVDCHFFQEIVNGKLTTTRTIKKVKKHGHLPVNRDLFSDE